MVNQFSRGQNQFFDGETETTVLVDKEPMWICSFDELDTKYVDFYDCPLFFVKGCRGKSKQRDLGDSSHMKQRSVTYTW